MQHEWIMTRDHWRLHLYPVSINVVTILLLPSGTAMMYKARLIATLIEFVGYFLVALVTRLSLRTYTIIRYSVRVDKLARRGYHCWSHHSCLMMRVYRNEAAE